MNQEINNKNEELLKKKSSEEEIFKEFELRFNPTCYLYFLT